MLLIAVDVGGTKIDVALFTGNGYLIGKTLNPVGYKKENEIGKLFGRE